MTSPKHDIVKTSKADEERYALYRHVLMRLIGSNADLCTTFINSVSSQAGPAFANAFQAAQSSRSVTDLESFLKCLHPGSAECQDILTAIARFVRDELRRHWAWLCFEFFLMFAERSIASLVPDGEGPELEIGYSLRSSANLPLGVAERELLKTIAAAEVRS